MASNHYIDRAPVDAEVEACHAPRFALGGQQPNAAKHIAGVFFLHRSISGALDDRHANAFDVLLFFEQSHTNRKSAGSRRTMLPAGIWTKYPRTRRFFFWKVVRRRTPEAHPSGFSIDRER